MYTRNKDGLRILKFVHLTLATFRKSLRDTDPVSPALFSSYQTRWCPLVQCWILCPSGCGCRELEFRCCKNADAAVFRETWRARPAAGEVWDRCQIRCLRAWKHDVSTGP